MRLMAFILRLIFQPEISGDLFANLITHGVRMPAFYGYAHFTKEVC
jgi:hypothetical protein